MDWKSKIAAIANRFKEPSSWAGLGMLATLLGLHLSSVEVGYIVDIGMGICGLTAFFMPEVKK